MADGSRQPAPKRRAWTTTELSIVRQHYPAGGINGVIELLPHRTRTSIYQRANALGLRCEGQPLVRQSWSLEPGMDDAIRHAHQRPMARGDVIALAKRLARPVWWVSRRARELNLTTPRFREPPWSEPEIALLRDTLTLTAAAAQAKFKRHGFRRTATAIAVQRKRQSLRKQAGEDYNCASVAQLLGHDRCTVLRWIRMDLLSARPDPHYRVRDNGQNTQYRITARDLRNFIINHPVRVDLRKLPVGHTPWFIELLAGRGCDTGLSRNDSHE